MENNKMNKNDRKNKLDSKKKTLICICLIGLLVLAFGQTALTSLQTKVNYNNFIGQVDKYQVESANIDTDSGKVEYKLKDSSVTYYTNYPYTEKFQERLLEHNVKIKMHEDSWLLIVLKNCFPLIVLGLFFVFYYVTVNQSSSQYKIETKSELKTKFSDVAGMEEIKEDMLVLADMMKYSRYRESGARIPRGVLLQGPPGNGKTLIARAFAKEAGVNFIAINACDFGSQFVGIGTNKINKVFEIAKENAPCVIFIDELDSVGSKRAYAQDAAGKEMNTMLTALLNQMDGFKQSDNVMVLAATNRAQDLDDALIRPGRFDRQFIIDYPDKKTRMEIFKLYTKNVNLSIDVDFDALAKKTCGYSCSKIECVVNEAIINSVKDKRKYVVLKDFNDAILQINIKGKTKKQYQQSDWERGIVAYHEAGHAVLSYFLTNKIVTSISIMPTTSGAGGFTITEDSDENSLCPLNDYINQMAMMYGGRAGEVILTGSLEKSTAGAIQDIKEVTKMASSYVQIEKGIDYSLFGENGIKESLDLTKNLLSSVWEIALNTAKEKKEYIDTIAKYLLDNESMNEREFINIITMLKGPSDNN